MNFRPRFEPDWSVSPGATIRAIMASRNLLEADVSAQLDLDLEDLSDLIEGRKAIDQRMADRLAEVLGTSPKFWLRREESFRQARSPARGEDLAGERSSFIANLPVSDMRKLGWISDYDRNTRNEAVLSFFEDEFGDWRRNGRDLLEAVAFRTSQTHAAVPAAVAAWLRQGVIQARQLPRKNWNADTLRRSLDSIRILSREKNPTVFFPKLVEIGLQAGVSVVCVRTPKGCRASGATHFAPDGTPIIQLSFRYRSDDHFWFTVFHEIGHLILHHNSPMFVEGIDCLASDEEAEADKFAQNTLIPPSSQHEISEIGRDFKKIMRFARRCGISAGIVVGQMQKRNLLRYDEMNFLKTRYDWSQVKPFTP
ncbi:MAG: ImmA/IrrE family metallo-endopeptidase [Proteobacteria bacterium]|nr:ImmA/IrrE family metallo-endopeptidase [Pseudomonadota bacterium]